jgi:hypothetical protein
MIANEYATYARNLLKMACTPMECQTRKRVVGRCDGPAVLGTAPKSLDTNTNNINSDSGSNLLICLTGHGGDHFFKHQDEEETLRPLRHGG